MTDLTGISEESNYRRYLKIMTDSCSVSSKGIIPRLIKGRRVLDVGCGSGVLLECLQDCEAEGIDLNRHSVEVCRAKGLTVHCKPLSEVEGKYDTIIFSSVLHEFSSYADRDRFTDLPIRKALQDAYRKLGQGGRIVIRDGVEAEPGECTLRMKNRQTAAAVLRYALYAPMFRGVNVSISDMTVTSGSVFLKEFMYTYTWGEESYHREMQEKFGILTDKDWCDLVESCGFHIVSAVTYPEEYAFYLSKHFEKDGLEELFSKSVILIAAERD